MTRSRPVRPGGGRGRPSAPSSEPRHKATRGCQSEETMNDHGEGALPGSIDLTNCDREPIHIPGCIQPHGMLLVLEEAALSISQVSANAGSFSGVEAEALLGRGLEAVLDPRALACVRSAVERRLLGEKPTYLFTERLVARDRLVHGVAHHHDGLILLEL